MTRLVVLPFVILAAVGLALSVWAHFAAILGAPQPLGSWTFVLHPAVFVVWIPTIVVSNRLTRGAHRRDFWKVALCGCPAWLRWLTFGFLGYAVINFVLFGIVSRPGAARVKFRKGEEAPPPVVRLFTGHWMAFYAAAFSVLYSAAVISAGDGAAPKPPKKPGGELDELIV